MSKFSIKRDLEQKDNFFKRYADVQSTLIKDSCRKKKYTISILIPTCKRVKTLRETLVSCIKQKGGVDFNIIVCDNNPERGDETEQYISKLNIPNLKYYKNVRGIGMFGNINRLYELSDGYLSVCIHDDDMLFPHFLQIAYNVMSNFENIDILFPRKVKWEIGKEEKKPEEKIMRKYNIRKITEYDLLRGNSYPPTGFIAKTSRILGIGGFDESKYPSSDYYFNEKAIKFLNVFELSQPLYIYRWSINATLKLETLLGFLEKDIPLMNEIANSSSFLKVFKGYLISEHCKSYLEKISSLYPEYNIKNLPYFKENVSICEKTKNSFIFLLWRIAYKIVRMRTTIYIK